MSNVKQFIDLYSWKDIGYSASINETNYTLFAMKNFLKIALIVPYPKIDIRVISDAFGKACPHVHKSIKHWYLSKCFFEREESSFVMNS